MAEISLGRARSTGRRPSYSRLVHTYSLSNSVTKALLAMRNT